MFLFNCHFLISFFGFVASVLAAKKGGIEVKHARNSRLKIDVKGKTREGVVDVLTSGNE